MNLILILLELLHILVHTYEHKRKIVEVFMKFKNSAFTLAETLITLGIIGVVAAITIPSVINKIDDMRYKSAVKKNYSVFSNALNMVYAGNWDDFRDWDYARSNEFVENVYNKLSEHMVITKNCGRKAGCMERPKAKNGNYATYSTVNGGCSNNASAYSFILNDGTAVTIDIWFESNIKTYLGVEKNLLSSSACFFICTDVNGNKGPNTTGKDVHMFILTSKGLVPAGIDNESKNCDNKSFGSNYDCTAKFLLH